MDQELKIALGRELCAITGNMTQAEAASRMHISQAYVSALRRECYDGFSAGRLARLISRQHYNIEVHLRCMNYPYAHPYVPPTLVVIRYDRYSRLVSAYDPYGAPVNFGDRFSKKAASPSAKSVPSAMRASSSSSRSSW